METATGKCLIVSAPSGAGKTTIVKHVLGQGFPLEFSISACSREKRDNEKPGQDYHFFSAERFRQLIEEGAFIEWEEVYPNQFYGTLKSEIERIWGLGKHVIFDVDVIGGLNLKANFGDNALALFIMPPSIDALASRLRSRGTETSEKIELRISKAASELELAPQFDHVVINDDLAEAQEEVKALIAAFLND